jgi:hypothetical protein
MATSADCSVCRDRRALDPANWDGGFKDGGIHTIYFEEDFDEIPGIFKSAANHEPNLCVLCFAEKTKMETPKTQVASPLVPVDDGATCPSCHPEMGGDAIKHAMVLAMKLVPNDDSKCVEGPRLCGKCMAMTKRVLSI